jgi:hypothetical protein
MRNVNVKPSRLHNYTAAVADTGATVGSAVADGAAVEYGLDLLPATEWKAAALALAIGQAALRAADAADRNGLATPG